MAKKYPAGTRLTVTFTGEVTKDFDPSTGQFQIADSRGAMHWVVLESKDVTASNVSPPLPDVVAGEIWMTYKGPYFARLSRHDIPLRMTPSDLSSEGGLKTLEIRDFFTAYPKAVRVFRPAWTGGTPPPVNSTFGENGIHYVDAGTNYSRSHEASAGVYQYPFA